MGGFRSRRRRKLSYRSDVRRFAHALSTDPPRARRAAPILRDIESRRPPGPLDQRAVRALPRGRRRARARAARRRASSRWHVVSWAAIRDAASRPRTWSRWRCSACSRRSRVSIRVGGSRSAPTRDADDARRDKACYFRDAGWAVHVPRGGQGACARSRPRQRRASLPAWATRRHCRSSPRRSVPARSRHSRRSRPLPRAAGAVHSSIAAATTSSGLSPADMLGVEDERLEQAEYLERDLRPASIRCRSPNG